MRADADDVLITGSVNLLRGFVIAVAAWVLRMFGGDGVGHHDGLGGLDADAKTQHIFKQRGNLE